MNARATLWTVASGRDDGSMERQQELTSRDAPSCARMVITLREMFERGWRKDPSVRS